MAAMVSDHPNDLLDHVKLQWIVGFILVPKERHSAAWLGVAKETKSICRIQRLGSGDVAVEIKRIEPKALGDANFLLGERRRWPEPVQAPEAPTDRAVNPDPLPV